MTTCFLWDHGTFSERQDSEVEEALYQPFVLRALKGVGLKMLKDVLPHTVDGRNPKQPLGIYKTL